MFNGHKLIKEETLRLDHDETALTFTKNDTEEAPTMTKEELVTHMIQHAETFPDVDEITTDTARSVLGNLDPAACLPDLTAEEFTELWNRLVHDPDVMSID